MELKNKKIAFLGDSITQGVGASSAENTYWSVFGRKTGARCFGYGISGTRIAPSLTQSPDAVWDQYFASRVGELITDADIVVIFGGTNDYGHGDHAIGKPGDTDETTFCGAYYVLINAIKKQCPNAVIVAMTPIHRENEEKLYNELGLRNVGTLKDYCDAIISVARLLNVKPLDMFACCPIQPDLPEHKRLYCPDGLHPNDTGHEMIADCLIAFLNNEV